MTEEPTHSRRSFLGAAAAGIISARLAYVLLAARGCRVVVPYLRGYGSTRFLDAATPRSGQQAAIGVDLIALMDALHIERAVLAGYDWGGRAACVAAALWPQRCAGLVSVNSYLIQDISKASIPLSAKVESGLWYQFYFTIERGRAGLTKNRRDIARLMWSRNSPNWHFDDATFDRSAAAFDNPDYVDVVIHSYRHRLGVAAGFPQYEEIEKRLAAQPTIAAPTITMDGDADGVVPATDGKASAAKFTGEKVKRTPPGLAGPSNRHDRSLSLRLTSLLLSAGSIPSGADRTPAHSDRQPPVRRGSRLE